MSSPDSVRSLSEVRPPVLLEPAAPSALAYRTSESFGRLAVALAAAQAAFPSINKCLTATVTPRRENARPYTYDYVDLATVLEAVRPVLAAHGLAMLQLPHVRRGAVTISTMIVHGESNEWLASDLTVALESGDPQAVGSAITYARRYGLTALVGVAAGVPDDDAAAATPTVTATVTPRPSAAPAPTAAPSAALVEPAGFADWWQSLEVAASHGLPTLESAWGSASGAFKTHATTVHREAWQALKTQSQHRHGYNGRAR